MNTLIKQLYIENNKLSCPIDDLNQVLKNMHTVNWNEEKNQKEFYMRLKDASQIVLYVDESKTSFVNYASQLAQRLCSTFYQSADFTTTKASIMNKTIFNYGIDYGKVVDCTLTNTVRCDMNWNREECSQSVYIIKSQHESEYINGSPGPIIISVACEQCIQDSIFVRFK